ncbi:hypothetical protein SAMN02745166_03710 [Prosthecobacter debontii]|uniref:Lipoprotein n=1 Tax=Prosthecobacter debontii TaxID=48467 RepID=A0A1T4YNR4_9BACT|nr:hypothetical protein [Prosthecobacter debontii]SKB02905.1 hypothetical protein SAMN02745166_03710 [Prosthecobacter debontii]
MNTKTLFNLGRALLALVGAVGLMSCASPIERRISSNPEIYSKLSDSDKVLINQGRIREGLSKEGVFLAWGRPDNVAAGSQKGVKTEKWTYLGSQPVYTDNWGWGGGWGGYGRYGRGFGYYGAWDPYWGGYGTSVTYIPYKAASVTFRNNRVTEYLRGPQ